MNLLDTVQARYAEILKDVPEEHHSIFGQEASYVCNMTGGRRSDALRSAVAHGLDGLTSPLAIDMRGVLYAAQRLEAKRCTWCDADATHVRSEFRHTSDGDSIAEIPECDRGDRDGHAITCVRCGKKTTDPDLWDPEAATGRIFCDRCWPHRHEV